MCLCSSNLDSEFGNLLQVLFHYEREIDVNAAGWFGQTALHNLIRNQYSINPKWFIFFVGKGVK